MLYSNNGVTHIYMPNNSQSMVATLIEGVSSKKLNLVYVIILFLVSAKEINNAIIQIFLFHWKPMKTEY